MRKHSSHQHVHSSVSGSVLGLLLGLSLLSGCQLFSSPSRVIVLGLDGLDPRVIDLLLSEGQLPNFAQLRQNGAYGKLRSIEPLLSPLLWTTIATGKRPSEHGIHHFVAFQQDKPDAGIPVTSDMRQVKALWNIASEAERSISTVGWWATWPAEAVNGQIVSDHTCYHFLFRQGEGFVPQDTALTHPSSLLRDITPLIRRPMDVGYEEMQRFCNISQKEFAEPYDVEKDVSHLKWVLATSESYRKIGLTLWTEQQPDLLLVYIEGTDSTEHLFGHLFRAEGLAGELAEQHKKFGHTVEEIYRYADEILGDYMAAMDDDTTLVVLSDHGFDLGQLHDDPSKTRDMRRVSERFHNVEGIVYLYGKGVAQHGQIQQASILDITPTILALLGLPIANDMPGRVLMEAFTRPPSLERIASYEGAGATQVASIRASTDTGQVNAAIRKRLQGLGYLGDTSGASSPQGDRNLAGMYFEEGRYTEAVALYEQLVADDPDAADLRTSLAGALGALERYADARQQLDIALELDPLNPGAYHNRAVLAEREGDPAAATADYQTALRYFPQYEPARQALLRLTGSAAVNPPQTPQEEAALSVAETASEQARRGNYDEALALLDQAEHIAPGLILVYQYRANIAYLKGDLSLARAALEQGLALEPDNALLKHNLAQLSAPQP